MLRFSQGSLAALLALILGLQFDLAWADERLTTALSERLEAVGLTPTIIDSEHSTESIAAVVDVIEQTRSRLAGPGVSFPRDLLTQFDYLGETGGSYVANHLTIAYTIARADGAVIPFSEARAAIVHEYAHAIFDVMMSERLPAYREHYESKVRHFATRDRIEELARRDPSSPKIDQLIAETRAIVASRSKDAALIYEALLPYNELFADLVGVMITRDGRAMSRLVETNRAARDFIVRTPLEGYSEAGDYTAFAPARSRLGAWLGLRTEAGEAKGTRLTPAGLVTRFLDAVTTEYREFLQTLPQHRLSPREIETANRRLIRALDVHL